MLARFLLSTFLLTTIIFGKSTQFSPIPAASNEVLTIDPQECDEECQKKLLEDGKVFTFISKHNDDSSNTYLRGKYQVLQSIFKIEDNEENTEGVKIALLAPTSVIGRYSSMVTDAVSSFLIYKKQDYTLKVYDSKTEDYDALYETIEKIKEDGFTYVIAPLTPKGVETLTEIDLDDNFIYVP
ncbi:MAG: hypothetical protein OIF32_11120, partial [Campylobacterales bacterium]|nr:hypothetical protein [Campylobacterales bacterium]